MSNTTLTQMLLEYDISNFRQGHYRSETSIYEIVETIKGLVTAADFSADIPETMTFTFASYEEGGTTRSFTDAQKQSMIAFLNDLEDILMIDFQYVETTENVSETTLNYFNFLTTEYDTTDYYQQDSGVELVITASSGANMGGEVSQSFNANISNYAAYYQNFIMLDVDSIGGTFTLGGKGYQEFIQALGIALGLAPTHNDDFGSTVMDGV